MRFSNGSPHAGADARLGRAIVFIFMGTDLARQFEFIKSRWANDGDFTGLGTEKDPLIGDNDTTATFTIPQRARTPPPAAATPLRDHQSRRVPLHARNPRPELARRTHAIDQTTPTAASAQQTSQAPTAPDPKAHHHHKGSMFLTRVHDRLLRTGTAQLAHPNPRAPTPLRAATPAYDTALDELTRQAGLAA